MAKDKIVIYPAYFKKDKDGYFVSVPDLGQFTQGEDLADAISMARDLIGLMCITYEDEGIPLPEAGLIEVDYEDLDFNEYDITTLVDVNLTKYRRAINNKAVHKNCTLPMWLCSLAEEEGVNFSKTLQEAVANKLGVEL